MTTATQQTPPTPAQRLAAKIRARTNDTRDILNLLHDIAQGGQDATEHDQLTATGILFDRGYGKCPKQPPASTDPVPETDDDDVGAIRESSPAVPHKEPESPRLVTQIDDSLHESLGPAPGAQETAHAPMSPDLFDDPSSIQSIIRDHIISITNDGDTLIDVLMDIAWPDDSSDCPEPRRRIKPFHRNKAGRMLLDRGAGTDPTPNMTAAKARPKLGQSLDPDKDCVFCSPTLGMLEGHEGEHRFDEVAWDEAIADLNRLMEKKGLPLFDPANPPKSDPPINISMPPPEWEVENTDVIRKEAAEFWAEIELRIERQKQWPAIEERRRKKLAKIYPSHSEDGDPPDT